MEKQKLGSTPNEAPTLRKAYCEPKLSLISFRPEQGFATSVYGDAPDRDDSEAKADNMYSINTGVWED